jgi:isoquinoline 1-oxidoreductase alpha subunit
MAQAITLNINGQSHTVQAEPEVPLLWVIREYLQLSGTNLYGTRGRAAHALLSASGQPGGGP